MNLKIIEETEKPLLSRKEIKAEITFDKATPSNEEVKKSVAAQTKADESLVVVKSIYTEFGATKATATVYVYTSKEDMEKIEPKKKEKAKPGAPAAEAPAAPAEKKEEAPKEEAKPEKKSE